MRCRYNSALYSVQRVDSDIEIGGRLLHLLLGPTPLHHLLLYYARTEKEVKRGQKI